MHVTVAVAGLSEAKLASRLPSSLSGEAPISIPCCTAASTDSRRGYRRQPSRATRPSIDLLSFAASPTQQLRGRSSTLGQWSAPGTHAAGVHSHASPADSRLRLPVALGAAHGVISTGLTSDPLNGPALLALGTSIGVAGAGGRTLCGWLLL